MIRGIRKKKFESGSLRDMGHINPEHVVHLSILLISVNLKLSISKLLQVDLAQIFDSTFAFWFYRFFGNKDTTSCQSRLILCFFSKNSAAPII